MGIKLIVFGLIFVHTSANIAFSNRGMRFVVACPWWNDCRVIITTPAQFVSVTFGKQNSSRVVEVEELAVERNTAIKKDLNGTRKTESGIFSALAIDASGPIRVVLVAGESSSEKVGFSAFVLIPKRSCHRSYYVTTVLGNPFIAVMSFDNEKTVVTVEFPDYMMVDFEENCFASDVCGNDKAVTIELAEDQVWYFQIDGRDKNLYGARITSGSAIHVITGNRQSTSADFPSSASVMKSTVTWGKTYIVPPISQIQSFIVDVLRHPLVFTFHEEGKDPKRRVAQIGAIEVYGNITNPLAVTAPEPFGLHLILTSRKLDGKSSVQGTGVIGMLSMIPVEQWFQGTVYTPVQQSFTNLILKYIIVTDAEKKDVRIQGFNKTTASIIRWHGSVVTVGGRAYSIGDATLDDICVNMYLTVPSVSLILYVAIFPKDDPELNILSLLPYEFYQGEIYQVNCKMSTYYSAHDGVDNDCDGRIDEEEKNELDDDRDGLVDEDYMEVQTDGQWSDWRELCEFRCFNKPLQVKTRQCVAVSPFGEYCKGESIICGGVACPRSCNVSNLCYCDAGCISCRKGTFECDRCKEGYAPTRHCTTRCPRGWSGLGCMDALAANPLSHGQYFFFSFPFAPLPALLTLLSLTVVVIVMAVGKNFLCETVIEQESQSDESSDDDF